MIFMKSFCSLVNLNVSWGTRKLKVCVYETTIIMGGMIATTRMKITIRGMVTMMKALDLPMKSCPGGKAEVFPEGGLEFEPNCA